jgi:thiol:disulfide interchange protein DsbC
MSYPALRRSLLAVACGLLAQAVLADEAAIRKNLVERLPKLPTIDEVNKTEIPGLYEVRLGGELVYTDESGTYLLQGNLIDTRTRTNITEARLNKLNAINFAQLPLKDAIVWKNGTGARKIAVFADPNCGYCKRFEADLQKVKNVTVYTFLIPVLGGDSPQKSENIWCAKDPAKTWLGWMLDHKEPPKPTGACSTPLERNMAFATKYRINGTPAIIFADGTRVPGAINTEQIEKQLLASTPPRPGATTN